MSRINLFLNLDIVNALIALAISFFAPVTAFILLFFKIPLMLTVFVYMASVRRKRAEELAVGPDPVDQVSK
jgi:hypothetical protein